MAEVVSTDRNHLVGALSNLIKKDALVRVIQSSEHSITKTELIGKIQSLGTDKYDKGRQGKHSEFYKNFDFDLFAVPITPKTIKLVIEDLDEDFRNSVASDSRVTETFDLLLIYNPEHLIALKNVYDEQRRSDLYKFNSESAPKEALEYIVVVQDHAGV